MIFPWGSYQATDANKQGTLSRIRHIARNVHSPHEHCFQCDRSLCTVFCALYYVYYAMWTVFCVLCNVNCVLCTVVCALCSVNCVVCTVLCAVCSVNCGMCIVFFTLCSVNCIVWTVLCVLCYVNCVLCTVLYALYCVDCVLWNVFSTLCSAHDVLWTRSLFFSLLGAVWYYQRNVSSVKCTLDCSPALVLLNSVQAFHGKVCNVQCRHCTVK